jgi:hypothetical protein
MFVYCYDPQLISRLEPMRFQNHIPNESGAIRNLDLPFLIHFDLTADSLIRYGPSI